MAKINEVERKTQNRVLALFRDPAGLDYEYYGNLRQQLNYYRLKPVGFFATESRLFRLKPAEKTYG